MAWPSAVESFSFFHTCVEKALDAPVVEALGEAFALASRRAS